MDLYFSPTLNWLLNRMFYEQSRRKRAPEAVVEHGADSGTDTDFSWTPVNVKPQKWVWSPNPCPSPDSSSDSELGQGFGNTCSFYSNCQYYHFCIS